jgi:hypothetical protein
VPGPGGDRLEGENVVEPGTGPSMHVHYLQEEAFAVQRGLLGYQRPGGRRGSRDPARRSCSGWASRKALERRGEDLLCAGSIEPAHNADCFLAALFESQRENGGIGRICSTRLFFYTKEL